MSIRIGRHDHAEGKRHVAGSHRARPPAETFEIASALRARCGISRLANVTGLDRIGLPVYVAIRPASRSLATSQGKGLDATSARVSALMEAIECWHAENIDAPLRDGSYVEISRRVAAVDPTTLPVPAGADVRRETPLRWIEGFDLVRGETVLVPLETATLDTVLRPGERQVLPSTSNGLASGNHILEAIVHGLCEVIERDSVTRWQRRGGSTSGAGQLDLAGVQDPGCGHVLGLLRRAGVHAAAWDVTSDLGIATYAVEIFDGASDPSSWRVGAFGGYGTHLAPEIAMMRALSEAIQSRLTFISGSRDDLFRDRYAAPRAALAAHAADVLGRAPSLAFPSRASLATDAFHDDLARLVSAVTHRGIDRVIVVDLSKPGMNVSVVKVIVPGLLPALGRTTHARGTRAEEAALS